MALSIIEKKIYHLRGERVMLDFDLAALYEVETRALNQAVKRNLERFPPEFMFQITREELDNLMSQIVISSWGGIRKLPYAFTEHGVSMLAGVLKSEKAIKLNLLIIKAFIALRRVAIEYKELTEKLAALEKQYNRQFADVYQALNFLIEKKKTEENFEKRRRIGFKP